MEGEEQVKNEESKMPDYPYPDPELQRMKTELDTLVTFDLSDAVEQMGETKKKLIELQTEMNGHYTKFMDVVKKIAVKIEEVEKHLTTPKF